MSRAASRLRPRRLHSHVGPRVASLFDPNSQLRERRSLREASSSGADARRYPIREGHLLEHMTSSTRVDLAHPRKVIRRKPASRSDEGWPQAPMDKGDLAPEQTTHENIITVANRSRNRENLATLRMRPP